MTRLFFLALALLALPGARVAADVTRICTGSPNSVSPGGARLRWSGAFRPIGGRLDASELPADQMGMVLYGLFPDDAPFADGRICIGGARWIMARVASDRSGHMSLDIAREGEREDVHWLFSANTWFFQYWYRDPAAGGAGSNLTDAIRVAWE